jgi:hypothetical protein
MEELNSDGGPGSGRYPKGSGEKAAGEANSAGQTTRAEEKRKKTKSVKIDLKQTARKAVFLRLKGTLPHERTSASHNS